MLTKRLFTSALAAALALGITTPAFAQAQGPVYTTPVQQITYRAAVLALAPASSATDFFTITGSATKQVRVKRIACNGISTAAATAIVQVVKRSTANSAGTATTPTKVPLNTAAGIAATGVVRAYTANPTLGTAVGTIAVAELTTNTVATSAFNNSGVVFDFRDQWVVLNGTAQVLALNGNAASFTSGAALNCEVEWSEV